MIGYVTLGTNDLARASAFYDSLLGDLGAKRGFETERMVMWSKSGLLGLSVCKPYDGQEACVGNGVMIALPAASKEQVDALYNKALELGGSCEGAPGNRMDGFYAAYFRDPDGNKLNFFFMG